MKITKVLLSFLLTLTIFGCSPKEETIEDTKVTGDVMYDYYVSKDGKYFYFDGNIHQCTERCGTRVYEYVGTQIPEALGLPEYSSEQIEEMANRDDYSDIADEIHTLADAVHLFLYLGFSKDNGSEFQRYQNITYSDYGNLCYDDNFVYCAGGLELMSLKKVQCSACSTLFKYLLEGDYPEIGYVVLNFDRGGHSMLYVKAEDGKYYLLNPSDYLNLNLKKYQREPDILQNLYIDFYYNTDLAVGDSLEELMTVLANIKNLPADKGATLTGLFTYCYDGVSCIGATILGDSYCDELFPEGSNAQKWAGVRNFQYATPKYNTDQEYIIGLPQY